MTVSDFVGRGAVQNAKEQVVVFLARMVRVLAFCSWQPSWSFVD